MRWNALKRLFKVDRDPDNYRFENHGDSTKGVLYLETQYATITDPGDSGTITPVADSPVNYCAVTTAGAGETRVLGTPDHIGQTLIVHHAVDGGDFTITLAAGHKGGGASDDVATFAEVNDLEILMACGTAAADWRWVTDKGVAFA